MLPPLVALGNDSSKSLTDDSSEASTTSGWNPYSTPSAGTSSILGRRPALSGTDKAFEAPVLETDNGCCCVSMVPSDFGDGWFSVCSLPAVVA